jgi:thioredoxin 1
MNIKTFSLIITAVLAFAGGARGQEKKAPCCTGIPTVPPQVEAAGNAVDSAKANTNKRPRLVDIGASKCIPCKMMAPILEDLKKSYEDRMDVEFIDVWKSPDSGKNYGIKIIPTQIFYSTEGKELFRHEGFFGKEDILAKWKELGVDLSAKTQ